MSNEMIARALADLSRTLDNAHRALTACRPDAQFGWEAADVSNRIEAARFEVKRLLLSRTVLEHRDPGTRLTIAASPPRRRGDGPINPLWGLMDRLSADVPELNHRSPQSAAAMACLPVGDDRDR